MSTDMKGRLNICILINDTEVPLWIYKGIENLTKSKYAIITLIVSQERQRTSMRRQGTAGGGFLIRIFETIDSLLFRSQHNSQQKKDITLLTDTVSVVNLNNSTGGTEGTSDAKKNIIANLIPDVVILFGRTKLDEEILGIPRYGVWAFSVDYNKIPGTPTHGFQEVIKHHPLTDIAVEIVKADQAQNEVIYALRESTYHFSVTVNRNKIFWRATLFLPRMIEGLFRFGDSYLNHLKERHKSFNSNKGSSAYYGSFLTVFSDLSVHIAWLLWLGFNKLIHTDAFSWNIQTKIVKDFNNSENDFSEFKTISSPRELYWADPFVVAEKNNYYVFVEEFIYRTNKAHISVLELDRNGHLLKSEKIIDRPYHMSYPFVFKFEGMYYMIPETNQNRTIELYKCSHFPFVWTFERCLMENISATDTTLFHHDNNWWLFTTIDHTGGVSGCSTELFLFYTDDPVRGEWVSHPLNPVISDESIARCAGKLFIQNGKIFRPSQDCSMRYGRGLNINHVTKLSKFEYNEVLINEIKPTWDPKLKGLHIINFDKDLAIIDTYKYHKRLSM